MSDAYTILDSMLDALASNATLANTKHIVKPRSVFAVPAVMWMETSQQYSIQVAHNGINVLATDGNVQLEEHSFQVGCFLWNALDYNERNHTAIMDVTNSLLKFKDEVRSVLNFNYLTGSDLVRPLVFHNESRTMKTEKWGSVLRRDLFFTGGLNVPISVSS